MILFDFDCPRCGRFESLVERPAPDAITCKCGWGATRVFPCPALKTPWGSVSTGESQERPPWALDTRVLASDGAGRRAYKRNRREARIRARHDEAIRNGLYDSRIQV